MVWAAFSARGKSPLVVLTGRENSETTCTQCLNICSPSHILTTASTSFTSRKTPAYMFFIVAGSSSMKREFRCLTGRQSHPISTPLKICGRLCRQVYSDGKQFERVSDLKAALFDAWDAITHATLVSLVRSMPRRRVEVVEKKGNKTHY